MIDNGRADIQLDNLVKRYRGQVTALDGVSLQVAAGSIFGFLGPNGAGKSTAIKIITTLALPTEGRAMVAGYDVVEQPAAVRRLAGVALQEIGLDPLMKAPELLTLQARLFGLSAAQARRRAQELLELVQLTDARDRKVGTYSGGMRRRLDLALALVHEPRILFLDEPTTGLDPASRRDVWREVRRLNRQLGMTIFLTTQYLEEADELADTIAILNQGKLAVQGTPSQLKASLGQESINLAFADPATARRAAALLSEMQASVQTDRELVRVYLPDAAEAIPSVMKKIQLASIELVSLTLTQPSLDDVFLDVTGQRFETELERQADQAA